MNVPSRVDLSQLSRPRALLIALKQYTARELGHPLETLHLYANWTENRMNKEWKVSLQLEGLLISGRLDELSDSAEFDPVFTVSSFHLLKKELELSMTYVNIINLRESRMRIFKKF